MQSILYCFLSARRSKLAGSIPSSIGNLTNLTWLELGENKSSGALPLSLGSIGLQLQYIYLGNNRLTGAIPPSLYKLTGLQSFYLNDNALTGGGSPLISDVSSNKLTRRLPPLPRRLGFLDMSGNAFTGEYQGVLKNLCHLWLRRNEITGEIPVGFACRLRNLISLDLSENQLRGPIPQGKPFSDFPAAAFAGNAGLCDHPLPACKR